VRALPAIARRHAGLVLLLCAAAALRALAIVAISPGIWFSDSNSYIASAATGRLSPTRVDGYALVVAPFWHLGSASALIALQHVLGLLIVVALYALLARRGVPRWLALLGVVPAALDAYLVVVEHAVMAETVWHVALVGAVVALLWSERPRLAAAAAAGLLLGYAGVVRSAGVPLMAVFLAYLLLRRVGWRPIAVFCACWLVVLLGYAALFDVQHGKFGFTESGGRFLYGKVAPFTDCSRLHDLPADERPLCPDPRHRLTTNQYLWSKASPIKGLPPSAEHRIRDFAMRALRDQPGTYAHVVLRGVLHYFEPGHRIGHNDYPVTPWQFPSDPRVWGYPGYRGPIRPGDPQRRLHHSITEPNTYVGAMVSRPRLDVAVSRFLHGYQTIAYTYGPLLAACVLIVLVALVARRGPRRQRLDAALLAAVPLLALLVAQALSLFSYRYGLIAALLMAPAAAMAGAALLGGRRVAPAQDSGRSSVAIRPSACSRVSPCAAARALSSASSRGPMPRPCQPSTTVIAISADARSSASRT
jgi:hypothetical protein